MTTTDAAIVAAIPSIQFGRPSVNLNDIALSARINANALVSMNVDTASLERQLAAHIRSLGAYQPIEIDGLNFLQVEMPAAEERVCNEFRSALADRLDNANINSIIESAHTLARAGAIDPINFTPTNTNILATGNEPWDKASAALERALALREPDATEAAAIRKLTLSAMHDLPRRPMGFAINRAMPLRSVTLFSGHGGLFKSTLMLQAAISVAEGRDWHGLPTHKGAVVAYFAEDPMDEVRTRSNRHCLANEIDERGLDNVYMLDLFDRGEDPVLVDKDGEHTIAYADLWRTCAQARNDHGAVKLIIIDNASHVFCGNENDRQDVTRFMRKLQKLAWEFNAAVLLLHHVSKSGASQGNYASGSTAWTNAARAVMTVDIDGNNGQKVEVGADNSSTQRVIISHRKTNYSEKFRPIRLEVVDAVPRLRDMGTTDDGAPVEHLVAGALARLVDGDLAAEFGVSMQAKKGTERHAATRVHRLLGGEVEYFLVERHCWSAVRASGPYEEVKGKDKHRNQVTKLVRKTAPNLVNLEIYSKNKPLAPWVTPSEPAFSAPCVLNNDPNTEYAAQNAEEKHSNSDGYAEKAPLRFETKTPIIKDTQNSHPDLDTRILLGSLHSPQLNTHARSGPGKSEDTNKIKNTTTLPEDVKTSASDGLAPQTISASPQSPVAPAAKRPRRAGQPKPARMRPPVARASRSPQAKPKPSKPDKT